MILFDWTISIGEIHQDLLSEFEPLISSKFLKKYLE
jgi:hypothetical protein